MSLLDYFKGKNNEAASANLAKERLKIIVAHERAQRNGPDYLPALKRDILEVIKKYVPVNEQHVDVQLDNSDDNLSVLELNITLPSQ